jgi:hypothetical protein
MTFKEGDILRRINPVPFNGVKQGDIVTIVQIVGERFFLSDRQNGWHDAESYELAGRIVRPKTGFAKFIERTTK